MSRSQIWLLAPARKAFACTHRPLRNVAGSPFAATPAYFRFASRQAEQRASQAQSRQTTPSQNNPTFRVLDNSRKASDNGKKHSFDPVEALDKTDLVSTPDELADLLAGLPEGSSFYIDLEGHDLSRYGTLDIISVLIWPEGKVHLIDVFSLGKEAFTTSAIRPTNKALKTSTGYTTLKALLEDPVIPKYLWDVRSDADALWSLYGVNIRGVIDLQLLENAARGGDRMKLNALWRSISEDSGLSRVERRQWRSIKDRGRQMMAPRPDRASKLTVNAVRLGDNWITNKIPKALKLAALKAHQLRDVESKDSSRSVVVTDLSHEVTMENNQFRQRPMDPGMMAYCANDVVHLPALHRHYLAKLKRDSPWHERIRVESNARIDDAQTPDFQAGTAEKGLSPWGASWEDVFEIDADEPIEAEMASAQDKGK